MTLMGDTPLRPPRRGLTPTARLPNKWDGPRPLSGLRTDLQTRSSRQEAVYDRHTCPTRATPASLWVQDGPPRNPRQRAAAALPPPRRPRRPGGARGALRARGPRPRLALPPHQRAARGPGAGRLLGPDEGDRPLRARPR